MELPMHLTKQPTAVAAVLRQIRPGLIAAAGLSIFINLLVFVSPLYSMQIYDRVLTSRNAMTLLLLSLIALALFCSYAVLEHFRSRVLVQTGIRFDRLLSGDAFESALARSLRTPSASHIQLLRDVDTLRDLFSGGVMTALMDLPYTPVYLAMCFLLHFSIGMVAFLGTLMIIALAFLNERATRDPLMAASFRNLQALDRLTGSLRNAEAIRALGMGPAIRSAWATTREQALLESTKAGERGGTLLAISKFLRMALQMAIMGTGAYLVINQEVSGGVLFAASLIMGRALAPVEVAVAQWRFLVAARTSFARLTLALGQQAAPARPMRLPTFTGEVSVENLTVLIPGTQMPAIAGASLRLSPGEDE